MVLHSGVSCFTADLDKPRVVHCLACGLELKGERVTGPRSWAGSMAGIKSEHWSYACPHSELEDHEHLVALLKEIEKLISERLKAVVQSEYDDKRLDFIKKHFRK